MLSENNYIKKREELFMYLYKQVFPIAARYISKRGGSFEQAGDVFQEALIVYYEKTRDKHFALEYSEKSYLMGIVKHVWLKQYKKDNSTTLPEEYEAADIGEKEISSGKVLRFLEVAGKKCMEMLTAVYYHNTDMKELAQRFGFSGERSATVQKHKCLEKVRDTVKEKSLIYEDFLE